MDDASQIAVQPVLLNKQVRGAMTGKASIPGIAKLLAMTKRFEALGQC